MNTETIDVCVCTFRRLGVADTIRSIGEQMLPENTRIRLIVVDNDVEPIAEAVVREAAAKAGLELAYVHAPARNISIARNACLDAAKAPLVAFIDDDEIATPNWLASLWTVLTARQADVALGQVRAIYDTELPAWVQQADLHSIRPVVLKDGRIDTGCTANVLFRREVTQGHRFDLDLGVTGGEDDVFFSRLAHAGALFVYSPEAIVEEVVPPKRGSMRWLLRRAFRSGQTYGSVMIERGTLRPVAIGRAGAKAAYCAGTAALRVASPTGWRRATVRGALHVGVLARLVGVREIRIY